MKILLVDDDACILECVGAFLGTEGHEVVECLSGNEAVGVLETVEIDLVLSGLKMPGMSGIDLLKKIKQRADNQPFVVLVTGFGTVESAVQALKLGAFDYFLKPVSAQTLLDVIEEIKKEPLYKQRHETRPGAARVRGGSSGRVKIHAYCEEYAQVIEQALAYHKRRSIPVIIEGETGTGKELVARLIHYGEDFEEHPFVAINCAAIPANLFESDLFGYEAGAFTGGQAKGSKGKVDAAEGGTLFLDEIAEIPLETQAKLLRFLQEREFYRVAGTKQIRADVRIICATNMNLEEAVAHGSFRADLYYRLKVGKIHLHPLRACRDQILPLAETFMRECSERMRKAYQRISVEAIQLLVNYDWPGNIRELKNLIEWVVLMHDDDVEIKTRHLASIYPEESSELLKGCGSVVSLITERRIETALAQTNGNKKAAAELLGISRRTLYRHLQRGNLNDVSSRRY